MLSSHPSAPSAVFLDRILRDLDSQLDRLQSARETIAGLSESAITNEPIFAGPSVPLAESAAAIVLDTPSAPAAAAVPDSEEEEAAPPRRRGRPAGSRNRFPSTRRSRLLHTPEPRALASSIPAGPVVVSAADIARKREAVAAAQLLAAAPAAPVEGTLEALIREVESRRHAA